MNTDTTFCEVDRCTFFKIHMYMNISRTPSSSIKQCGSVDVVQCARAVLYAVHIGCGAPPHPVKTSGLPLSRGS